MRFSTLDEWLRWQEGLHPRMIDLGLTRAAAVAARMGLNRPAARVITVGGTNGKGSTVAYLEALLQTSGHRPGAYTSPHLQRYNERIRIDGREATDEVIVAAFEAVDRARSDITLTYFEFATLAAFHLFQAAECDPWILEVGLGGRLDAVNVLDADVAVLTNVELDHTEWLGHDREHIGWEKAGIMRANHPVIFGADDIPRTVLEHALQIGGELHRRGRDFDFGYEGVTGLWWWRGRRLRLSGLPIPGLAGGHQLVNAAVSLAALETLGMAAMLSQPSVCHALKRVSLPGRLQRFEGPPDWVLDVAHNAAAAARLAVLLQSMAPSGCIRCLFAILRRKDLDAVVTPLLALVDEWYLIELDEPEAMAAASVAARLQDCDVRIAAIGSAHEMVARVQREAGAQDLIIAYGSFRLVAAVMHALPSVRPATVQAG